MKKNLKIVYFFLIIIVITVFYLPVSLSAQVQESTSQQYVIMMNDVMNKLNEMDKNITEIDKKIEVRFTKLEARMENLEGQPKGTKMDVWILSGSLILLFLFILGIVLAIYKNVKVMATPTKEKLSISLAEEIKEKLENINEQVQQIRKREEMLEKRVAEIEEIRQ